MVSLSLLYAWHTLGASAPCASADWPVGVCFDDLDDDGLMSWKDALFINLSIKYYDELYRQCSQMVRLPFLLTQSGHLHYITNIRC